MAPDVSTISSDDASDLNNDKPDFRISHDGLVTSDLPVGTKLRGGLGPETVPARMGLSLSALNNIVDIRESQEGRWAILNVPATISIVIPTLNEADNLRRLLPTLPEGLHQVVIVDGYSTDDTLEVAKQLRPDADIVFQNRRGKGNAMAHGFSACTGDIIVMMDADGSADPTELARFIIALLQGADFAKGSRYCPGGGSDDLTGLRSVGNRGLNRVVNTLYGTRFSDLCYGYNVFWRHCLDVLELDALLNESDDKVWGDGFEIETLIATRVIKAGLRVVEVPSFERERWYGESNLNSFRDGFRVLRTALVERVTPAEPQRLEIGDAQETLTVGVLICAHTMDRLEDIDSAMSGLAQQTRTPQEVVLVIDYNDELFDVCQYRYEGVTVVKNTRTKGLSGARNTGLEKLRTYAVCLLDDDATPRPEWLAEIMAPLEADPKVSIVGGKTLPKWDTERPPWWPAEFDWAIGCTYQGIPDYVHEIRNPWGCNAAFRREVFDSLNQWFREDIGRTDNDAMGCEETELTIRYRQLNTEAKAVFTPGAVVDHRVRADRATWEYFTKRCRAEGRSKAVIASWAGSDDATSSEKGYVTTVLPSAVSSGMRRAIRHREPDGARRAASVVGGLGLTAGEYVKGRLRRR